MSTKGNIKLNIDTIKNKPYPIGRLTQSVINTLGLSLPETDIVVWGDRIQYIEKHKKDFKTEEEFKQHVEAMPEIINSPDYVGLHPKGDSIQYIKKIDEWMLVGVRIKVKGNLVVRSTYPITQDKLNDYIASGTVKRINS